MKHQDNLIYQWKQIRSEYFNKYNEDLKKFKKIHGSNQLYHSIVKHLDKSFKEVNQIAQKEIELLYKS